MERGKSAHPGDDGLSAGKRHAMYVIIGHYPHKSIKAAKRMLTDPRRCGDPSARSS